MSERKENVRNWDGNRSVNLKALFAKSGQLNIERNYHESRMDVVEIIFFPASDWTLDAVGYPVIISVRSMIIDRR